MQGTSSDAALVRGVLGRKYLRQQALLSSVVCLLGSLFFYLLPSFPFDRRIAYFSLAGAVLYGAFYLSIDRLKGRYYLIITALSVLALAVVSVIVHMTGGIVSPFIFFYFAILISEAAYGVERHLSVAVAALLFSALIACEYFGVLTHSASASAVYASLPTTLLLVATIVVFMFVTGSIGRFIIRQLRRAVEEEAAEKQEVISKLNELEAHSQIGILAHRIAHDLRAPLSSISGYVQMEMLRRHSAEDAAALRDINAVVDGMAESLKNITQFGKSTSHPPERIRLGEFLTMLLTVISYSPQARGVIIKKLFPDSLDLQITAAKADLQQAFFNVLRNAVEAVRDNAGERLVSVNAQAAGSEVEISVIDNGPGMQPELLKQLFRKAVTTKKDGTGVGLLITRDLLVRNDGDIQFFNLPEGGLRAVMRFPLA